MQPHRHLRLARSASTAVRARFAPSPTGQLHLGGLRTALFNYLFARHAQGTFLLRIEDTDQARLVPGAADALVDALKWAGIQFDEGPHVGGPHGPYVQSQRLEIYRDHARQLIEKGRAYPCFCSPARLDAVRAQRRAEKQPVVYDRHCLHTIPPHEALARMETEPHMIRFKAAPNAAAFHDLVYGSVPTNATNAEEDFVILKTDGFPTYHLANVVDDHLMEISHVMRGEEWIPSTPKHINLYEAFGWKPPKFAHLPILVGKKGNKLSKRDGDVHVGQFRADGWEPEALVNFVALLSASWPHTESSAALNKDVLSMQELIDNFSWDNMTKHRSQADPKKLAFLNKRHLLHLQESDVAALAKRIMPRLQKQFPSSADARDPEYVALVAPHLLEYVSNVNQLAAQKETAIFFAHPDYTTKDAQSSLAKITLPLEPICAELYQIVEASPEQLSQDIVVQLRASAAEKDIPASKVLHSLRYLVTGVSRGPKLNVLLSVLGRKRVLERLARWRQTQARAP